MQKFFMFTFPDIHQLSPGLHVIVFSFMSHHFHHLNLMSFVEWEWQSARALCVYAWFVEKFGKLSTSGEADLEEGVSPGVEMKIMVVDPD